MSLAVAYVDNPVAVLPSVMTMGDETVFSVSESFLVVDFSELSSLRIDFCWKLSRDGSEQSRCLDFEGTLLCGEVSPSSSPPYANSQLRYWQLLRHSNEL